MNSSFDRSSASTRPVHPQKAEIRIPNRCCAGPLHNARGGRNERAVGFVGNKAGTLAFSTQRSLPIRFA